MTDLLQRVQRQLDENHYVEKEDIQTLVDAQKWISVEDRLPDLGQVVWLYDGYRIWIGMRDLVEHDTWLWGNSHGTIWHDGEKWNADNEIDDDYQPTRWKPLREPTTP